MLTLIHDAKVLSGRIDAMAKTIADLKGEVHLLALSAMSHAQGHGDVTLLTRIKNALGKVAREKAFIVWVEAFTPCAWNEATKGFKISKKKREAVGWLLAEAEAKPYWEFTEESVPEPMTLGRLIGLAKGLEKKLAKAEKDDRLEMTSNERSIAEEFLTKIVDMADEYAERASNIIEVVTGTPEAPHIPFVAGVTEGAPQDPTDQTETESKAA